jgi:hypothetical protein
LKPVVGKVPFESPKHGFSCSLMLRIKEGREKGILQMQPEEERKISQEQVARASGILKKLRQEDSFK